MAVVCPKCGGANPEEARFCSSCGTSLQPSCARCGTETPPGARFCPSCGHQLTAPPQRLEERKLVTVLFADLSGSTALGERLDPERLRAVLTEYFAAMAGVIEAWGGSVEKFIGDAVMAAFGVPAVRENDAQRALHAALEMLQRLERLNVDLVDRHHVTLTIRLGINTGEVIAPVGDRMEELIVAGDAVNVAARLQAAAEPGTVLVGERTFAAARDAFSFSDPIPLELKGKSEVVLARRLLGPLAESERGVPGLRAQMVGRELELSMLTGLLDEAADLSEPRMAIVYGPAGIGKSRLVWELVRGVGDRSPAPRVLRGRCLAVGDGITYWALAEILRASCDIGLDDSAETVRRKLTEGVEAILVPLGLTSPDARETVFALAVTAGIELPENPLLTLEPKAVAEALARAWPRFIGALASERPTLLVVEDLHWAGDQLVEMLERILARASGPVMFVATARPEFTQHHPGFAVGREGVSAVSLRPLTSEQSGRLVAELLAVAELSSELRDAILEKAEGNPFFLEEIIRRLIDEGVLVHEGAAWRATRSTTVQLPDTVHALLAARIDALPAPEKLVLQEAAVVGKVFWAIPIGERLPDVDVPAALLGLETRGLILARPTTTIAGQPEYLFRHALIRDVAYAGLPRARRAHAHAALAAWTQQLAAERVDEFGELVAHNYWLAIAGEDADLAWAQDPAERERLRAKAFRSLMEAGKVARRRYALVRAVELHRLAEEVAGSASERLEAEEGVGDDHAAAYHGDEAVAAYLAGLEMARADHVLAHHRARLAMKAAREAVMKSGSFKSQVGPATLEAWIDEGLLAGPDDWARTWLLALRAGVSEVWISLTGDIPTPIADRIADAEEALVSARRLGRHGLEVYASEMLVYLLRAEGNYQRALDIARQRLELVDGREAASPTASLLFESAIVIGLDAGEWEEAERLAGRSREIARRLSAHELMHATGTLLSILYFTGRWSEAAEMLDEHMAAFAGESNVSCSNVRMGPAIGALIHAHRGDAAEGKRLLELIPPIERISDFVDGCRSLIILALGDPMAALAQAERLAVRPRLRERGMGHLALLEALAALQRWEDLGTAVGGGRRHAQGFAALRVAIDRLEGLRLLAAGEVASATAALRRSLETAERLGMTFEAARAREALAEAVGPEERAALLTQALEVYRTLGAQPAVDRIARFGVAKPF